MGKKPDGKRDQRCYTFGTLKEARDERSKIIADRSRGTLVKPTKITVKEAIDKWLDGRRNLRPSTARNYRYRLAMVSDRWATCSCRHSARPTSTRLVTTLKTTGGRVGNVQRQGLSPRSVNLMLTLLSRCSRMRSNRAP